MRSPLSRVSFFALVLFWTAPASPAQVILQDNFDLGDRPTGGNGNIRTAGVSSSLNGFWASYPLSGSARWRAIADETTGAGLWQFGGISTNPNQPPLPGQGPLPGNGFVYGKGAGSALLPFTPAAGVAYELAADLYPPASYAGNTGADWVALGFTSSNVIGPNLSAFGVAWVQLRNNGTFEFHVGGASPATLTGTYASSAFTNVTLTYTPAAQAVSLQINRGAPLTASLLGFNPTQIALEMDTQSLETLIAGADWVRLRVAHAETLGVSSIAMTAQSTVLITFAGVPGNNYLVQSADAAGGTYGVPPGVTSPSDRRTADAQGRFQFEDTTSSSATERFYRAVAVP